MKDRGLRCGLFFARGRENFISFITRIRAKDGSTGETVVSATGELLSAKVSVSDAALKTALADGSVLRLPITVPVSSGADKAAAIRVSLPSFDSAGKAVASMPKLRFEVENGGYGAVAYRKSADGSLTLIKETRMGSVIVPVDGNCELVIADNAKTFADVEDFRWYKNYVDFVTAREIFGGGVGGFKPSETMTRAMVAQMLYNFDRESRPASIALPDVPADSWFADAAGWAYASGIIAGSAGEFHPYNAVARQDLVTILYRYAKNAGYDVSVGGDLDGWADAESVSEYAHDAMAWALGAGVITGADGALAPSATARRAEVAAIMTRFVQNVQ